MTDQDQGRNVDPTGGLPSGVLDFLKKAIEAVPAVRYALGVGGIAAVIAIVAGFLDLRIAVVGIPILFVFMVILVIFARLVAKTPGMRWAVSMLLWCSVLIMIAVLMLFIVTFFVQAETLHSWGLNSFYELFGLQPTDAPLPNTP
jgi:hypothetical protein